MPNLLNRHPDPPRQAVAANQRRVKSIAVPVMMIGPLLLSACSGDDSVVDTGLSGGSSGDPGSGDNPDDSNVLRPFAGLWDISGNWNGQPGDEAVLAIGEPTSGGTAPVTLYDFEGDASGTGENCYRPEILMGELAPSLDGRLFLNDLLQFESAVVSLAPDAQTMIISYFDELDINANGDTSETIDYPATRVSMMESDLPVCA